MSLSPSKVLRMRFQLEKQLFSVSSSIAFQLEQVKQGIQRNSTCSYSFIEEKKQVFYADIARLTKNLTTSEEQACRLRYTGQGKIEVYEKMASTTDLQRVEFLDEPALTQLLTKDAEEPVGLAERENLDAPSTILVRGRRAKYPTFFQIGRMMNLSTRQVKTLLGSAFAKVHHRLTQQQEALEL